MSNEMYDYRRVLNLLKTNAGEYFPTYLIAQRLNLQANTVQRCINDDLINKAREPILKRRVNDSRVMSYAYDKNAFALAVVSGGQSKERVVRVSCPNAGCGADEFYWDEHKRRTNGQWLTTGVATCTCCGTTFELYKAKKAA